MPSTYHYTIIHSKNMNIHTSITSCSGSDNYKKDGQVSETEATYRSR